MTDYWKPYTEEQLHLGAHEGTGDSFLDPAPADPEGKAGGPLDAITSGLKVFADVGLTLGKSIDEHRESTDKLRRRLEANTPVDYSLSANGAVPAVGNLILTLGTPDQGSYWEVESVVLGGNDWNVVAAGSAALYVSGFVPNAPTVPTPGLTSIADGFAAMPASRFYSGRRIVVNDQEYLFAVIFAGTAGQQYQLNAQVSVLNVASARGKVSVIA